MPFSGSPFKDAVASPAGQAERPNLGSNPSSPTAGHTGETGTVVPVALPVNDLHFGTPDKAKFNQD